MKVGASVKKICKDCYILIRKRVVMCRCKNPATAGKHKQRQG